MLDEHDIIRLITTRFDRLPQGYVPIGDDVALIPLVCVDGGSS